MGHADSKTTQIYSHYAPSEHEVQVVNDAFASDPAGEPEDDLQAADPRARAGTGECPETTVEVRPRAALPTRRGTIRGTN